jgi:23S rRNA (uracil1939-C5)-methyltransferase
MPDTVAAAVPASDVSCPHHPRCPGCPLLALPAEEQLQRKHDAVRTALDRYPHATSVPVSPVLPAPAPTEYRLRAKLVVDASGIGLYERGTHRVIDTSGCRVLSPRVASAMEALRGLELHAAGVTAVDVREVDAGVLVTLAVDDPPDPGVAGSLEPLVSAVTARVPAVVSVAVSRRERAAPQVLGRDVRVVAGADAARHTVDPGAPFVYAAPGAFTQAHPAQLTALHRAVGGRLADRLGGLRGRRVLELYAGTGALGLRLARAGASVTLVERFAPAMELVDRAAAEQGLSLQTQIAEAAVAVDRWVTGGATFDAVIVNPPRRGVEPRVRAGISRLGASVAIYVSCEPRTLARDLAHLRRLGLAPARVETFDMIPLSAAVESVAELVTTAPPAPRVLFEDEDLIVVDKDPHEPVTPQSEHLGSLLDRVRDALGAPAAVPVHRLDLGTSGVCLFARRPAAAADLGRVLAKGQKSYVALVRGVTRPKGTLRRALRDGARTVEATTRYARRQLIGGHSLLEARPEHGRTHQIRRHLAGLGHPVVGDDRYGDAPTNQHFWHRHGLDRTFLHLARVELERRGVTLKLEAPLAADLAEVLASLNPAR